MKAVERDRFLISFLSALVIHGVIVLLLGFVDLREGGVPSRTLPPVAVRLELPDFLPERLREEAPEQPPEEIPEPEPALPEEELPEETLPDASEATAPQPTPQPTPQPAEPPRTSGVSRSSDSAGEGYTIPQPSEAASRRAEMEFEQGPRRTSRSSSGSPGEETPVSRSLEGTETRSVSSGDSRVVYSKEPENTSPSRDSRDLSSDQSNAAGTESGRESVLSEERLRELENIDAAGSRRDPGESSGDPSDPPGGDETAPPKSTSSEIRSDSGDVVVSLEEGHRTRRLLGYKLPDLTEEQISKLPGNIKVTVIFSLQPNGVLRNVVLAPGSSTGDTEIDNKILEAVREWKFTDVSNGTTEAVGGKAIIVIRAR